MAGAGSNWLSGVNVVLVMAYGSLVRVSGIGRDGLECLCGLECPRNRTVRVRGAPARQILARP